MRYLTKIIIAGALALATASTAIAQNASENSAQSKHGQQVHQGRPLNNAGGETSYTEWKKSDEARTFDRATYSGFVKY